MNRTRVLIMGATWRNFHNFNVIYRNDPQSKVVAFTATQMPNIEGRLYPPELSDELYPDGIPILDEIELSRFISELKVDDVVFGFSWTVRETSSGDWRRMFPSPKPISIVEADAIWELLDAEKIVIAAGGGGIPIYTMGSGDLDSFDAVVDKDLASAIVAYEIGAHDFFILTDVRTVFLNFGQKNKTPIHHMIVTEAQTYLKEGQFIPSTMEPKISTAMDFINRGGEHVFISAIDSLAKAHS